MIRTKTQCTSHIQSTNKTRPLFPVSVLLPTCGRQQRFCSYNNLCSLSLSFSQTLLCFYLFIWHFSHAHSLCFYSFFLSSEKDMAEQARNVNTAAGKTPSEGAIKWSQTLDSFQKKTKYKKNKIFNLILHKHGWLGCLFYYWVFRSIALFCL